MVPTRYAKNRFSIIGICLLTAFAFCNCATSRILMLSQNPGCETSIEGYYHCVEPWDKSKPALIFRQGRDMKILAGEIVTQDEKGVTFDPSGEGYIGDPRPEYFKFDKIETLIDENGKVIYGSIPKEYSRAYALELHLTRLDDPDSTSIAILLKPNSQFGFCVQPGNYIVSKVQFKNDYRMMADEGVDIPKLTISVADNRSNYIGDIYMDCGQENLLDPILIQYKVAFRQPGSTGDDSGTDDVVAGLFGGLVGGAIYAGVKAGVKESNRPPKDPKGIVGEHRLFIDKKDDFKIKGVSPKIDSVIEYSEQALPLKDQEK